MRLLNLSSCLAVATAICVALAHAETDQGFVKGSTTLAEVEQGAGAPIGTTRQADGSLTLVYPAARVVSQVARATAKTHPRAIALTFNTKFVLRNTTALPGALDLSTGYASR